MKYLIKISTIAVSLVFFSAWTEEEIVEPKKESNVVNPFEWPLGEEQIEDSGMSIFDVAGAVIIL